MLGGGFNCLGQIRCLSGPGGKRQTCDPSFGKDWEGVDCFVTNARGDYSVRGCARVCAAGAGGLLGACVRVAGAWGSAGVCMAGAGRSAGVWQAQGGVHVCSRRTGKWGSCRGGAL